MVIRRAKNASNFLKPYLSRNKNVNVSIMVMRTPPHIGILKKQEMETVTFCYSKEKNDDIKTLKHNIKLNFH